MRYIIFGFLNTLLYFTFILLIAFAFMVMSVKFNIFYNIFLVIFFVIFVIVLIKNRRIDFRYLKGSVLFLLFLIFVITVVIYIFPFNGPNTSPKSDNELGLHFERMTLRDGSQLAYRSHSPQTQPPVNLSPIIILHGGPGVPPLKSAFDFYPRLTASGRRVYVYEQIGVGQSSRLRTITDYTLKRNIDDLDEFRRKIGARKVVLVGQSAGTILAARYAILHREVVERMVLVSPAPFDPSNISNSNFGLTARADNSAPNRGALRILLAEFMVNFDPNVALMLGSQEEITRVYDRMWADPAFADTLVCRGTKPGHATLDRANGANYFALLMIFRSMRENSRSLNLANKLSVPVLILRGDCDFLPSSSIDDFRNIFSNMQTDIVKGAGHAVVETKPKLSERAILQFLAE